MTSRCLAVAVGPVVVLGMACGSPPAPVDPVVPTTPTVSTPEAPLSSASGAGQTSASIADPTTGPAPSRRSPPTGGGGAPSGRAVPPATRAPAAPTQPAVPVQPRSAPAPKPDPPPTSEGPGRTGTPIAIEFIEQFGNDPVIFSAAVADRCRENGLPDDCVTVSYVPENRSEDKDCSVVDKVPSVARTRVKVGTHLTFQLDCSVPPP